MKRTALTMIAAALIQFAAGAQAESVVLPSLEFSHDAVSAAMAGATLLDDDNDIRVSFQNWAPSSTSYFSAAGQYSFGGKFSIKAGGGYGSGKSIELTTEDLNAQIYKFTPSEAFFHAGVGYKFTDFLGLEAAARYANSKLAPHEDIGAFCADVLFKGWVKDFKFAAGVTNVGSEVQGCKLPGAVAAAAGYAKTFEEGGESHCFKAELDFKYYFYGEAGGSAGLAYTYNNIITVRGGFHAGGIVANHASIGLGVNIKGFHIDAAYLAGGQINNSFCIGMGYKF